jgi:hypothetical protein
MIGGDRPVICYFSRESFRPKSREFPSSLLELSASNRVIALSYKKLNPPEF